VGISATLTPEMMAKFDRTIDFFKKLAPKFIHFNILHDNGAIPVNEAYILEAIHFLTKSHKRFQGMGIFAAPLIQKINSFVNKKIIAAGCAACGHQISVSPQGKVGLCGKALSSERHILGSLGEGINLQLLHEVSYRSPLNTPECESCIALALCGGGCLDYSFLEQGDAIAMDKRLCMFNKKIMEWMLFNFLQ